MKKDKFEFLPLKTTFAFVTYFLFMGSPCEKRVRNNDEEVYLIHGEMQGVSKGNARFFYNPYLPLSALKFCWISVDERALEYILKFPIIGFP